MANFSYCSINCIIQFKQFLFVSSRTLLKRSQRVLTVRPFSRCQNTFGSLFLARNVQPWSPKVRKSSPVEPWMLVSSSDSRQSTVPALSLLMHSTRTKTRNERSTSETLVKVHSDPLETDKFLFGGCKPVIWLEYLEIIYA